MSAQLDDRGISVSSARLTAIDRFSIMWRRTIQHRWASPNAFARARGPSKSSVTAPELLQQYLDAAPGQSRARLCDGGAGVGGPTAASRVAGGLALSRASRMLMIPDLRTLPPGPTRGRPRPWRLAHRSNGDCSPAGSDAPDHKADAVASI